MVGANLTFDQDPPMTALYRRMRKKLNRPMKGFPGDHPLPEDGVKVHAIAVLCESQILATNVPDVAREIDAECTDVAGRVLPFRHMMALARNDDRFWFIWYCLDSDLADLQARRLADSPRRFRLFRKEDHHELIQVDLPK
jgi:hypothetical protein